MIDHIEGYRMKGSIPSILRTWREVRSGNRSITITRALMYSILSQIKEFKDIQDIQDIY